MMLAANDGHAECEAAPETVRSGNASLDCCLCGQVGVQVAASHRLTLRLGHPHASTVTCERIRNAER